jgi:hypothetical protein
MLYTYGSDIGLKEEWKNGECRNSFFQSGRRIRDDDDNKHNEGIKDLGIKYISTTINKLGYVRIAQPVPYDQL